MRKNQMLLGTANRVLGSRYLFHKSFSDRQLIIGVADLAVIE